MKKTKKILSILVIALMLVPFTVSHALTKTKTDALLEALRNDEALQSIGAEILKASSQLLYKQYKIGNKINDNQLKMIVNCCKKYYIQMKGGAGTAMKASEELKEELGGNWLIFISDLKS